MKPPSCNIAMAVQVNSRAHGVRYLKFHTSSMSSDEGSLRKKALSLQDWLDADGRPSTSEHTPDDTVSLAVAAPCQKRFQRLFYPVGNKGGGRNEALTSSRETLANCARCAFDTLFLSRTPATSAQATL